MGKKLKKGQDNRLVHWLVKEQAEALAGAYYELAASTGKHCNAFYKAHPNQKAFIKKEWPMFVLYAKEVMTEMLKGNAITEPQKQEIYHALILDATIPYSQQETQITAFRH